MLSRVGAAGAVAELFGNPILSLAPSPCQGRRRVRLPLHSLSQGYALLLQPTPTLMLRRLLSMYTHLLAMHHRL